jgi:hypothetical protein
MIINRNLLARPATFTLSQLDFEIRALVAEMAVETNEQRGHYLVAAYQALMWVRTPDRFTPPSEVR